MSLRGQATNLAILHGADILQPLLILPYAGLVLGPEQFGLFAYAIGISQIAATVVDYGFHWTAQRTAAAKRDRPADLASLLAEVTATKVLLCAIVIAVGFATSGLLHISRIMMLCAMLTAMGNALFPAWLFIGIEKAWRATFGVVAARAFAFAAFFAFVTSPARVDVAVAIQTSVPLVSGIATLPFIMGIGFSGFPHLTFTGIRTQLREGWQGFLFTLSERISLSLPVLLVQFFGGFVIAGQYSLAEKFVSATRPFFRVISDTLLPRVAYHVAHDPAAGLTLIWRATRSLVVGAGFSLGLFFVAPPIIMFIFGAGFADAIPIVRVMAVLPILLNVNVCTSTLYMFNFGHERAWSILNVAGLLVFLAAAFLLGPRLGNPAIAIAIAVIAKETIVLVISVGFFVAYGRTAAASSSPPARVAFSALSGDEGT